MTHINDDYIRGFEDAVLRLENLHLFDEETQNFVQNILVNNIRIYLEVLKHKHVSNPTKS